MTLVAIASIVFFQILAGVAIGFLTNENKDVTFHEWILSTFIFIVVNVIFFFGNTAVSYMQFVSTLLTGWVAVWGGCYLGNFLRREVNQHILAPWLSGLSNNEIKNMIDDFLHVATKCVYGDRPEDCEKLKKYIIRIEERLDWAAKVTKFLDREDLAHKFLQIKELCRIYFSLVSMLRADGAGHRDETLLHEWLSLGDILKHIAGSSLNYAENEIRNSLENFWGVKALRLIGGTRKIA